MATTATKLLATQNRLRYRIDADASGGNVSKTRAEIIADCAPGPLKAFFQNLLTWNNADIDSPKMSATCRYFGSTLPTADLAFSFDTGPEAAVFRAPATTSGLVAIVEFVFNPTPVA